eukprot:gene8548-10509_t
MDQIIDMLPTFDNEKVLGKSLQLIEVLGTQHISVVQLKRLLAFLDPNNPKGRLASEHGMEHLLACLDSMTMRSTPSFVFLLDGRNSGLFLDSFGKIPSVGYTVSAWLNISEDAFSGTQEMSEPRLFSFQGDKGAGIECYFVRGRLSLRFNSKVTCVMKEPFPTSRWCHLVITQSPLSKWSFKQDSSLQIYIDGRIVHCVDNIKYPSTSKPMTLCTIGTVHTGSVFMTASGTVINTSTGSSSSSSSSIPTTSFSSILTSALNSSQNHILNLSNNSNNSNNNSNSGSNNNFNLKCQLGSISMFGVSLSDKKITKLFKRGSKYIPVKKSYKPVFSFSPKTYFGGICHSAQSIFGHHHHNNHQSNKDQDSQLNAYSIGNLRVFSTFSINDSIYLIGGPQVLFPLLNLLSEPPTQNQPNIRYPSLESILSFMSNLLLNDTPNQEEMIKSNGIAILGHLLEKIFSTNKSLEIHEELIKVLDDLTQSCSNNGI